MSPIIAIASSNVDFPLRLRLRARGMHRARRPHRVANGIRELANEFVGCAVLSC